MGGFGSGQTGWKDKVEQCRSLDVNRLHRSGCLSPGYSGGWEWKLDGQRVANISISCDGDILTLEFKFRQNGGDWRDIAQRVFLTSTACQFGGSRPWFVCPGMVRAQACNRRVAKLYSGGPYFLCRHCYQLAYSSQSEQEFDRLLRRANKLRASLGGEPGMGAMIAAKPKGMHRKTYETRFEEILRLEEEACEQFASKFARF
ncbi:MULTISPECIES: hypothetical protein [Hyphobacterium]|uniref:Uncharacterized protein n=1 Tax=Hyphobacterium vulgare TaxID=1736751 RepID=A0ABV6ZWE5_9PROT